MQVATADGPRPCASGDWIVRGPSGQFFVMKNAEFEAYFEPQERRPVGRPRKELVNGY